MMTSTTGHASAWGGGAPGRYTTARRCTCSENSSYIKMLVPPDVVQEQFDVELSNIFALQDSLLEQTNKARDARNRLLPKLMSGEIEV
jgi:hypothetical protein